MTARRRPAFKRREDGEGRSTAELFSEARAGLRDLERLMEVRRDRDRASRLLTDTFTTITQIAERFNKVGPTFESRPPTMEDEEDERPEAEGIGMAELFPDEPTQHESDLAAAVLAAIPEDERDRVEQYRATYRCIEHVRAEHYRNFIDFVARGARQVNEVAANLLALARRVRPDSLAALGMGQVEISRKLGERRATTSAREKRKVEALLQANGTKGFHLHGTHKTETHRRKCAAAQKGNTNRADAHRRRQAASVTAPGITE